MCYIKLYYEYCKIFFLCRKGMSNNYELWFFIISQMIYNTILIRAIIPTILETPITLLCNICFSPLNSYAIEIPLKYLCCYAVILSFGDKILKKKGFICRISHHLILQIVRINLLCIDCLVSIILKCFITFISHLNIIFVT